MSNIGDAIRSARHAKGLTLAVLSSELGVSIPYLSDVERGNRRLCRSRLIQVAQLIDIDLRPMLVSLAVDRGVVDVSALSPAQVAEVVALVERLRATPAPEAT